MLRLASFSERTDMPGSWNPLSSHLDLPGQQARPSAPARYGSLKDGCSFSEGTSEPALLPALGLRRVAHHPQERADGGVVLLRCLKVDVVTRRWDQRQPRAGDRRV